MFINRRKSILRGPVVVWKIMWSLCGCVKYNENGNLYHAQVRWVLIRKTVFIVVVVVNGSGVLKRHADVQSFFGTHRI